MTAVWCPINLVANSEEMRGQHGVRETKPSLCQLFFQYPLHGLVLVVMVTTQCPHSFSSSYFSLAASVRKWTTIVPGGVGGWKIKRVFLNDVPYSGKLSREKTFTNWWKIQFSWRNFHRFLTYAVPKNATTLNFAEKTFANSHKFAIVFSLKSFPLYGNHTEHVHVSYGTWHTPNQ